VNVIDKNDTNGWDGYKSRGNRTTGDRLLESLSEAATGTLIGPNVVPINAQQALMECQKIRNQTGSIDVLVIGDHAAPGQQTVGDSSGPRFTPNGGVIDKFAELMTPNTGVLVLTGCRALGGEKSKAPNGDTVVDQNVIDAWQAYATAHRITIIGSVQYTKPTGFGLFSGVWVTLVPGGTAPRLTCDPNSPINR
jgi:hypothetical protein